MPERVQAVDLSVSERPDACRVAFALGEKMGRLAADLSLCTTGLPEASQRRLSELSTEVLRLNKAWREALLAEARVPLDQWAEYSHGKMVE
jgi:hypothetical protein